MKQARFIGEYPKVGIRPIIDARQGGVRESLEEQTMNMAKSVADLISSELKYSDGTPVQCVIADSTIGRVPEAAACAEKFRKEGVGVVISVTPCWFIWQQHWLAIVKKACLLLVFMDTMYRTPATKLYLKT